MHTSSGAGRTTVLLFYNLLALLSLGFAPAAAFATASSPSDIDMVPSDLSQTSGASTSGTSGTIDVSSGASLKRKPDRDLHLILDFDGTCTNSDTTPLLPRLASLHSNDTPQQREQRLGAFQKLEQEYFDNYCKVREDILRCETEIDDSNGESSDRSSRSYDPSNPDHLHEALEALDEVSTRVTHKVTSSSCLAGMPTTVKQITQLIEENEEVREAVSLQKGCLDAICRARLQHGWRLGVLSINWCPALIGAALVTPIEQKLKAQVVEVESIEEEQGDTEVWCNEITHKGEVRLTIPGASAKRELIASIKCRKQAENNFGDKEKSIVVYVGDSSTDLLGMLEADIGIMVGESSTVTNIAKKWCVKISHISTRNNESNGIKDGGTRNSGLHERDSNTVWMVDGWDDIDDLLQRISGV